MKRFGLLVLLCLTALSFAPASTLAAQEITPNSSLDEPAMRNQGGVGRVLTRHVGLKPDLRSNELSGIKPFVRGSYQQIVSARQGKPFIISFWSLSCTHCMDEMAMLKKLAKKYSKLDLVLVSTDTLEEKESVAATLAKFAPRKAETWLFADSYTDPLYFEIDKKWHGELPRTYFFSTKHEVTAISGKIEQKEVEQWIREQYGSR